jgi:hypothetical protein
MPITRYLDGFRFDDEAKRVMGIAFEMACVALRIDYGDPAAAIVAKKIIECAKDGERNPDRLCDDALHILRGPPQSDTGSKTVDGSDLIRRQDDL